MNRLRRSQFDGPSKSRTYIYDLGDDWQYRVKVEKILPPDFDLRSRVCLAGRDACPSEDVGGGLGYIEFWMLHRDHEELLEWYCGSFDSDVFDLDAVNQQLSEIEF